MTVIDTRSVGLGSRGAMARKAIDTTDDYQTYIIKSVADVPILLFGYHITAGGAGATAKIEYSRIAGVEPGHASLKTLVEETAIATTEDIDNGVDGEAVLCGTIIISVKSTTAGTPSAGTVIEFTAAA